MVPEVQLALGSRGFSLADLSYERMYNGPRHVVVIGSQQNTLLLSRCQANFKWVLPELWFGPSSCLKSQTQRTVVWCWAINPGTEPNGNFCLMHFQMNGWQDNAACIRWKQYGATEPVRALESCTCVFLQSVRACICTISLCAAKRTFSLPSAVRVPGSIQHLDQQVSPSCTSTLTHSTDLHLPAEGKATQLLTFSRIRIQSRIVQSYCNPAPAMFQHVQQFTDSVLDGLGLHYIRLVLFYFTFHVV